MSDSVKILLEVVDKASPELIKFQSNLEKTGQSMSAFAARAGTMAGAAVAGVVIGLATMAKNAINAADEMGKTAQKIGISVESLSALNYAAGLSDVSLEQLKTGFNALNKSMVEANDPASAAAAAFKYLGVEVKNADGTYRKADEVFKDIATAMSKLPDGTSKSAVAMEILGKAGADLIPLLNSGRAGLEELRAEAEKLGMVISKETAKQAEQFKDSLTRVSNAALGIGMSIAKEVLPTLNALAAQMVEAATKGEGFKEFAKSVGEIFKWVVKAGAGVVFVLGVIGKTVVGLGAAAAALAKRDLKGAKQAISFIGDATKESAAELAKFIAAIDAGIPPIDKSKKATDDAANAAGNYAGKSKTVKDAKDAEAKAFEKAYAAMLKESEGYKELTSLQQVEYNIAQKVAGFRTTEHQEQMRRLGAELDKRREMAQYEAGRATQLQSLYTMGQSVKDGLKEADQYQQELLAHVQRTADIMAGFRAQEKQMQTELVSLGIELRTLQETDPVKNAKRIADLQAEIDGRLEILNTTKQQQSELQKGELKLRIINDQNKIWNEYIGSARQGVEDLNTQYGFLQSARKVELISARELAIATDKIDEKKFALMRDQVTLLEKKTAAFAGQIQSTFGDVFYNIMQGNFKDIGTMFKQMLDKMVAEALAAQLAKALFGDFSRTGSVSGSGGGLLTSIMGSLGESGWGGLIASMFRAEGGPVSAGQPYIVGEKRAELFVPNRSGTILPDTSALAMAGGNNVNFAITAMDSQSVIAAIDKIKRPLAEMMNGTNRAYNLG